MRDRSASMALLFIVFATITAAIATPGPASAQAGGCGICYLVSSVDMARLETTVRELSGADSVTVGGWRFLIETRSSLLPQKDVARRYLLERIAGMGYEPERQVFPMSVYRPDLHGLAVSQGGDTVWCGSDEGELYILTAAAGWAETDPASSIGARIYGLAAGPDGLLWAACKTTGSGYGELHRSADRGLTWEKVTGGTVANPILSLSSIVFAGESAAIVTGAGGSCIRLQKIAGEWWTSTLDPGEFMYRNLNGAAASGPAHLWIAADGGTLFESEDLGGTWTARTLTTRKLWDVDFEGERGIAVGDLVSLSTADGGKTWVESAAPTDLRALVMLDTLTALAGGFGGEVYETRDGGGTWSPLDSECSREGDIWRLAAGGGSVWVSGRDELMRFATAGPPSDCAVYAISDTIFGENLVFGIEGKERPEGVTVISAHYDSRSWSDPLCAPGADDNASGCAGVLEAARVLAGAPLEGSVEFILFDGEEIGLLGSRHYVAGERMRSFDAVINLDMIGRDYTGGVRMEIAGRGDSPADSALAALIDSTVSRHGLGLDPNFLTTLSPTSDHKAFWDIEGVPAVLLIEGGYYDNPHYHDCSDRAVYLDYPFVADVVRAAVGAAAAVAGLAGAEPGPVEVVLHQNFPNPFSDHTMIRFEMPSRANVDLAVYDVAGRLVASLIDGPAGPGRIEYGWRGRAASGEPVPGGVYFLRLRTVDAVLTRKIVVLR